MKGKILFMLAALLLVTVAAFAGGGQEGGEAAQKAVMVTAPGTFPVVEEIVTIKVFTQKHRLVEDLNTNRFTQIYEDMTNVHFEFEVAPEGQGEEKRNLILASGDLPDVFMYSGMNATQMVVYGSQGLFWPLQDIIDAQSIHLKKLWTEKPFIKEDLTAPDGNIYALPQGAECFHCSAPHKMWIYQPWLDKLGLDMPQTTEEFYEVLKAFRDGDPNGNGKNDELPLTGAMASGDGFSPHMFIMNSFQYWDGSLLIIEDGKIRLAADTPEFKAAMKYMKRLYDEDLLAPETFTQDRAQLKQIGENPDDNIMGAAPALWYGTFTTNFGPSERYLDWRAVPALKGPDGTRWASTAPFRVQPHTLVVTDYEYPEVLVRWADWLYSIEGNRSANTGIKDEDWRWAKDGEVNYNNNPAIFFVEPHVLYNLQNERWLHTAPHFNSRELRQGGATTQEIIDKGQESRLYKWTDEFYHPYKYPEFMPNLMYGEEEALELGEIEPALKDAVRSAVARFVTGELDIDGDWNSYIRELEGLEWQRYVQLYQDALDKKMAAIK